MFEMTKRIGSSCWAIGSIALAIASFGVAAADSSPVAVSPLTKAQTIQVHESLAASLSPTTSDTLDVTIARPNKARVTFHLNGQTKPRTAEYVAVGKTEHEADSLTSSYKLLDPQPDGSSSSQIRDIAAVDMLLNNGQFGPAKAGVKRSTSTVTVNGQTMQLTTDTWPSRMNPNDGKSYHSLNMLWTDVATGLPYRRAEGLVDESPGGQTHWFQVLTFSNWVLNQPVQIAWIAPAGYTDHPDPKLLAAGTTAPDFSAVTADGKTVHLSDYRGKPVILDFWATWCGPCQQSMPHLEKVYDQVKGTGVAVLAVCVWDDNAAYLKWVTAKTGVYTFQTAFDPAGRGDGNIAGKLYNVTAIPAQYVIDKDGKVAAAYSGYGDGDHRLETALAAMNIPVTATPAAQQSASAK